MDEKIRRERRIQTQPSAIGRCTAESRHRSLPVTSPSAEFVSANHRRAARAGQRDAIRSHAKRDEAFGHREFEWQQFRWRCPVRARREAPAETVPNTVGKKF